MTARLTGTQVARILGIMTNSQKDPTRPGAEGSRADELFGKSPQEKPDRPPEKPKEFGGPKGPEPTRYGDWEVGGRCMDF